MEESRESLKIFLDSSVILSACGFKKSPYPASSPRSLGIADGISFQPPIAAQRREKISQKFNQEGVSNWKILEAKIEWLPNALTTKRPLLLTASKDKPVLISALAAKPDVLLTLDARDFALLLNTEVYGVFVTTPRDFLIREGLG